MTWGLWLVLYYFQEVESVSGIIKVIEISLMALLSLPLSL
jgi:hypothetical protein